MLGGMVEGRGWVVVVEGRGWWEGGWEGGWREGAWTIVEPKFFSRVLLSSICKLPM